jgi:SAM-dependent methyltransferase
MPRANPRSRREHSCLAEENPTRLIRDLYRGLDAFEISRSDARAVKKSRGSDTYGELQPTATLRLLDYFELQRDDVFVDLGSGGGKVTLAAGLFTKVRRARGVELSHERHALACEARSRAVARRLLSRRKCEFIHGDLRRTPLEDATVVYTCSTAFSTPFLMGIARRLARAPRLRCFASFRDLDPHPRFELAETLRLDVSWRRRACLYVYRPR